MEIDGLWCYLKKRRKLWIWKARNRNTGQLLDWEHESHDKVTIKRVIDRLAQWGGHGLLHRSEERQIPTT